MIRVTFREGSFEVTQEISLGNIDRLRQIGRVVYRADDETYGAISPGIGIIGSKRSLPEAMQSIIDFHRLTDYQYAPWPDMEEDEE